MKLITSGNSLQIQGGSISDSSHLTGGLVMGDTTIQLLTWGSASPTPGTEPDSNAAR